MSAEIPDDFPEQLTIGIGEPDSAVQFPVAVYRRGASIALWGADLHSRLEQAMANGEPPLIHIDLQSLIGAPGLPPPKPYTFYGGTVEVDPTRREIRQDGRLVALTRREYEVAAFLGLWPDRFYSQQEVFDNVWGNSLAERVSLRSVTVHIHRLRQVEKLGPDAIQIRRRAGYAAAP